MVRRSSVVPIAAWFVPVLLGLSLPATASAQPDDNAMDEARAHFERGVALVGEDKWDQALEEFSRSVELYPTAPGLINLGFCLQHLGRNLEAMRTFLRFLDGFGGQAEPQDLSDAQNQIAQLEALLGELTIRVDVDGAELSVDDGAVGSAPLAAPVYVEPGPHEVVARREDQVVRQTVTVGAGEQTVVELVLAPAAAVETGVDSTAETDDGGLDPVVFWSMLGVTGAAAIAWGVTGGLALAANDDYASDPHRTQADRDAGQNLAIGADVCGGVAIAAAVATTVLAFFVDWDGEGPADEGGSGPEAVAVSAGPLDGGIGLGVVGRF